VAEALARLEEPVVFPVHPRTEAMLERMDIRLNANVRVLPPAGYLDFAALASQSRVILTDSGGVQKEAYWYQVPCVTLRNNTEWVETIETGWNRLVGTDPDRIVEAVRKTGPGAPEEGLYGDGLASEKIVDHLYGMGASER
jgi:UDP-N-acetylglucosamine 2-epimerase